jgi:hypothetical protein
VRLNIGKDSFSFDKRLFFLVQCSLLVITSFFTKEMFLTNEFYYENFSEQISFNEINRAIGFQNKWGWLGYLLVPIFYALKFSITASMLFIGVFFLELKYSFKRLFQIAMIAEAIFLIPLVLKIAWFAFFQTDFTLEDFTSFYPLSLQNIFIGNPVEPWFLYPLQVVNVFELGYWFVLAAGISMAFKEDFYNSFSLVVKSYGLGLLLWVTLMIFLTLNFS